MGWRGPTTHRQFRAWQVWLMMDLDRPSRADWYSMEVRAEVRRGWVKDPGKVDANDFKLRFKDPRQAEAKSSEEERIMAAKMSRGTWLAAMQGTRPQKPDLKGDK